MESEVDLVVYVCVEVGDSSEGGTGFGLARVLF